MTVFYFNIRILYSCDHTSVSQDPSEIILICWFGAQEIFLYYYLC